MNRTTGFIIFIALNIFLIGGFALSLYNFIEGWNNVEKDDTSSYDVYLSITPKKESEETVETVSDAVLESEDKKQTLITFTIPQFIAVILTICLIEGLLLKLPWKKMIMACKRKKGFGEEDDELDNDIDENQE